MEELYININGLEAIEKVNEYFVGQILNVTNKKDQFGNTCNHKFGANGDYVIVNIDNVRVDSRGDGIEVQIDVGVTDVSRIG